jgi:hypothetical protein
MNNNIETDDNFIKNNYSFEFYLWLNQPYLEKTHATIKYYDSQIQNFISSIFNFLYNGGVCFSGGTLVFNDISQLLFNLLTYNIFYLKNNEYTCESPLVSSTRRTIIRGYEKISSEKVHYNRGHRTHNNVFVQGKGEPISCTPVSEYTKFERKLDPPITGLCNTNRSESKSVLLYYPFNTINNKKQLLFFKLERDEMISYGHLKKATATYIGNRIDRAFGTNLGVNETPVKGIDTNIGLDLRREDRNPQQHPNECSYDDYFKEKDIYFYSNYYRILGINADENIKTMIDEDINELNWYNDNVRTGCEFYVTKNLLATMIQYLLVPTTNVVLQRIISGGKKRKSRKHY